MTRPVKTLAIVVCLLLAVTVARSEPLTSADREALLESLEKLRENAESLVDARFRSAMVAYRDALASDEATMDFYLKCIEKVNFDDQQKKNAEFREWKRREADRLSDKDFRLVLRYQLRWLILYLRSASENADRLALAGEAQEIVDSIFRDAAKLKGQQQPLAQPITATVFAQAYEIGGLEKVKWPQSPVRIEQFYEELVFPELRGPDRLDSLRSAWIKRIQQEGIRVEEWTGRGGERKNGLSAEARSPEYEQFVTEEVPELQWKMEVDLFRSGDESGSAKRMLDHITKHINHRSSRAWGEQFRVLLTPVPTVSPGAASFKDPGN